MSGLVVPEAGEFMGKAPAYVKSIIAWHRHRVGKKIGACERDKAWGCALAVHQPALKKTNPASLK